MIFKKKKTNRLGIEGDDSMFIKNSMEFAYILTIELSYNPMTPLVGIYLNKLKTQISIVQIHHTYDNCIAEQKKKKKPAYGNSPKFQTYI